ncbi:MAG: hypothetical protein LBI41_02500 [Lactobacillales bacterium]|jgi:putative ABC transport system permease protein|nr:hypothetical protein [Lactobacillales bacterium]
MKRVLQLLLCLEIILCAFISGFLGKETAEFQALHQESTHILITDPSTSKKSQALKVQALKQLTKKYHLTIMKIIYKSKQKKEIYTNDISLNGWIHTSKSHQLIGNHYFTNQVDHSKNCVEKVRWLTNQESVRIYSLDGLKHLGLNGEYHIWASQKEDVMQFIKELEQTSALFSTIIVNKESIREFLNIMIAYLGLVFSSISLFLITLYCLLFYLIQQSKRQSLQILYGYSRKQQLLDTILTFQKVLLGGIGVSGLIILGKSIFYQWPTQILGYSLLGFIISSCFILLMIVILIGLWHRKMACSTTLATYVKEKTLFTPLLIVSKIFILIFLAFFPYCFSVIIDATQKLYEDHRANEVWKQAEEIYQFHLDGHPFSKNKAVQEKIQLGYRQFYQDNYDRLALIYSGNYASMHSGSKQKLYQWNTHDPIEELTSPSGKSIIINATYLQWNPIVDNNNQPITKQRIDFSKNSYTALVPEALKKYEENLRKNLIKDYQFQCDTEKLPNLNLIYVKNHQRYFTYCLETAKDTSNIVTDPLVIVDIGNIMPYQYVAYLSSSIFFKASKTLDAYSSIRPSLKKHHLLDSIPAVSSIYDERGEAIERVRRGILAFILCTILLCITLSFCIYCFNYSLYEKNQKRIHLKQFSGYPWYKIVIEEFFCWVIADYMIFGCSVFVMAQNYARELMLILSILELVVFVQFLKKRRERVR